MLLASEDIKQKQNERTNEGWVIFIVKLGKAQGVLSMLWLYALRYRRDSFSIESH